MAEQGRDDVRCLLSAVLRGLMPILRFSISWWEGCVDINRQNRWEAWEAVAYLEGGVGRESSSCDLFPCSLVWE